MLILYSGKNISDIEEKERLGIVNSSVVRLPNETVVPNIQVPQNLQTNLLLLHSENKIIEATIFH